MNRWLAIVGTAAVFVLCDSLAALWGKRDHRIALILFILLSPLGYCCFGLLNRNTSLSAASGLVNVFLIMGTVSVGIYFFDEKLGIREIAGLGFAIMAIILLAGSK